MSLPSGRESLRSIQLERLNSLISEILPSNRFYTAKLGRAGINGPVESLDEFQNKSPFTTKEELVNDQTENPPYGTNLTYPLERYTRFSQTSATTGSPLRWLDSSESWDWMLGNWKRVYEAAGMTNKDRIFFAFSFGPFLGFWTAFESAAGLLGCLCLPGGGMSSNARLQSILDNSVTVLCCTPTYAIRLAQVAEDEGIDLSESQVRRVIVAGEPGGSISATRATIEGYWRGARVFDHHGMTEVGPVSYESSNHPGVLHVIEESYFAEVVDPDSGEPVQEGETGELVLTTLGREGSPLLRYRTGDLVRPDWNGADNYGDINLALVGGILGRSDDMVVVRGVNLFPSAVEDTIRSCGGVAEYRVTTYLEKGMTELLVEVEPTHADSGVVDRVCNAFRTAFNLRIPVKAVPAGSLPRFEMKAKRWQTKPGGGSSAI